MVNPAAPATDPETLVLLGSPFHDVTMEETIDWVARMITRRQPSYLVTANLDFATQAAGDVELQRILVEAELVLCDGMPLVWASRLTGRPLRERVAGSDLVPRLAERGVQEGWRFFLLGGEQASLDGAARTLQERFPGVVIAGAYSPPFAKFHEMNHAEIAARVREAKPDILLVAFGCPKQEKWIYAHYRELGVPVSVGVGATIDFLAGKVRRAPPWLAALGLEWLFRALQEPKRLAMRYAKDLVFLVQQVRRERHAILAKAAPQEGARTSEGTSPVPGTEILFWKGDLVTGSLSGLRLPTFRSPFVVDLSGVTLIDSHGLGQLLYTIRRGWAAGVAGCFAAPSEKVRHVLSVSRLDRVLPVAPGIAEARALLSAVKTGTVIHPVIDAEEASILLTMPGELVAANATACGDAVMREWKERPELRYLRLDMSSTRFMDSSGLGFLIRCYRSAKEREGAKLELLHLQPNVLNVIKLARLQPLLGVGA